MISTMRQLQRAVYTREHENETAKGNRLATMRERARYTRENESEASKQTRLAQQRLRDQQRLNDETDGEREFRLADLRVRAQERLNSETEDERESRLADLRIRAQQRLNQETDNQREARLAEMNATAQRRLDQENSDERDARLSDMRVRGRQSAIFNDAVFTKMNTFHKKMSNCDFLACPCCNESFPADNPNSSCAHCVRDKHQPKLYSHDNDMDPGILPPELQGLSQIEEVLISAIVPMMSVYKLPHGQYGGYSGHVLNLPQNVSSFAKQLPRLPSELDVVLVRKVYESGSHKDFRVRRSNVVHALQWLKAKKQVL